jgi:hypothetical protein
MRKSKSMALVEQFECACGDIEADYTEFSRVNSLTCQYR